MLATEGAVHVDKTHEWHMETIREICLADEKLFQVPQTELLTLMTPKAAIDWWLDLTEKGGEGIVVKPYEVLVYGKEGLLQPAIKCRGSEYLRIN